MKISAGPHQTAARGRSAVHALYTTNVQTKAKHLPYSFAADLAGTGGQAAFVPASNPTDSGVAKVGSTGTIREITISNAGNMPAGCS